MQMLGGFVPLVLHDPDQREATMAIAEDVAANMEAAGGTTSSRRWWAASTTGSAPR